MQTNTITNALTIDFEDWYQGLEIPHTEWAGYEDRVVFAGRRLLRILEEAGTRATFFILGYVAEQHPEIVREIAAAGHEIGTHGYSHTLIYQQSPDLFRGEMGRAIKLLEDITGQGVLGHRAPFFSITRDSLWALEVLGELGIRYDSSIFPVLNYRYGIADAPRWPYQVAAGQQQLHGVSDLDAAGDGPQPADSRRRLLSHISLRIYATRVQIAQRYGASGGVLSTSMGAGSGSSANSVAAQDIADSLL